jgi:bla regulator protein blaR1
MIGDLGNHLWQSTVFVAVAALVTFVLRNNGAHVRHAVWTIASLKFLVPFSLLMSLGGALPAWTLPAPTGSEVSGAVTAARDISVAVDRLAQPFAPDTLAAVLPASTTAQGPLPIVALLGAAWALGFLAVVAMRVRGWRHVRAAVRASVPLHLPGPYPVRSAPGLLEPGVVGIRRPVLLLPAGIEQHLSPAQLRAVLEHEFCHIRRRDNLTSALHMVVEAVCWFHPLVWWVGARMVDERERACDEQVLRACGEPQAYAESILNVCKLYVESPLACVSGVSGSDLKKRVTAIMAGRVGAQLTVVRKLGLATVATLIISAPLLAGMAGGEQAGPAAARFEVVSVKPCQTDTPPPQAAARPGFRSSGSPWAAMVTPGHVYWHCATLAQLVPQAFTNTDQPLQNVATGLRREDDFQPTYVKGGPSWVRSDRFTIEAKAPLEMTSPVLGNNPSRAMGVLSPAMSQALRAVLEDRFQLKVGRAAEQRDMYAMTIAPGGLNKERITTPVPGDCQTIEQYAAAAADAPPRTAAERVAAGNPRICGRAYSGLIDGQYAMDFTSVTLQYLATFLSGDLDYVVVDRTGTSGVFNFMLPQGSSSAGTRDEHHARALAGLGLKLDLVKGPAEYLAIESVQRLRPNPPASAEASAGRPVADGSADR